MMMVMVKKLLRYIERIAERVEAKAQHFYVRRSYKIILGSVIGVCAGLAIGVWASMADFQVLNPQGEIADKQLQLLIFACALSLFVIVPVFALIGFIAWHYRETNAKAMYVPTWEGNVKAELAWWGIPFVLIGILSVVIWQSSHALDPYRPLENSKEPVTIQVVSLQWRWLFIYPDEGIATINHITFPEKTPVNFVISADSPMNSFWIPNLGGQVYAMNGMSTKLHLAANGQGIYPGSSVNISGKGFAKMKFTASAVSQATYDTWVKKSRESLPIDWQKYQAIRRPTEDSTPRTYSLGEPKLYDKIVEQYMHGHDSEHAKGHHE